MAKKYLDQAGLKFVIGQLNDQYRSEFVKVNTIKASEVAYKNANIDNNADIKVDKALDVIVANVVALTETTVPALQSAIDAKVAQADYNAKMQALDAEDARIAGLVASEAERAAAAEVAALKAGQDAQADVDAVEKRLDDEGGLVDRIEANEAFKAAQADVDAEQDRRLGVLEGLVVGGEGEGISAILGDVANLKSDMLEAQGNILGHGEAITALEGFQDTQEAANVEVDRKLGVIQGEGEGSIKKAVADAKGEIEEAAAALAGRVAANEAKFAGMEKATVQAAIDALEEEDRKIREEFAAADSTNLQAAKDYADQAVANLVNSAPEDLNTLKELADAIEAHQEVYEGYVTTVNGQIATAKQEAIDAAASAADSKDAAVKAEIEGVIDGIEAAMATETARVNKKIADDIAAESALRVAEEGRIEGLVTAEATKAREEEGKLQAAIDKLNGAADAEGSVAKAVADEAALRVAADNALQAAIDALAGDGEGSVAEQVGAVQDALDAFEEAQAAKEEAQDGKISALEAKFGEGEGTVKDMVADAEAAAKQHAESQDAALKALIDADIQEVEKALADEKDASKEGSLAKQIADEVARATAAEGVNAGAITSEANRAKGVEAGLQTAIDTINDASNGILAQAKAYTDTEMNKIGRIEETDIQEMLGEIF